MAPTIKPILGVIFSFVVLSTSAWAADPKPFPDFTFKRLKVPTSGSGPRIRVQIQPEVEASADPSETTDNEAKPNQQTAVSAFEWFWAEISPSLAASGPGRLEPALNQISSHSGVATPRVAMFHGILERYQSEILVSTIGTQVSPALVLSVIAIESSGEADAVSQSGAIGLMQLMPATAERFGVTDRTDPGQNIKGGVAYLDWLIEEFGNDPILVLAAYNAGEGAVRRYEGVPPFAETRAYVPKVLSAWSVARGMCQTPPELISDGCAFSLAKS